MTCWNCTKMCWDNKENAAQQSQGLSHEGPFILLLKRCIISKKYMESINLVKFTYSHILDRVFSELIGVFNPSQAIEIRNKMLVLSEKWHQYESKIIDELKKYPPYKFSPQHIRCYIVKDLPYTGISDPLIIKIIDDLDLVIATLVHELVHISISQEESGLIDKIKREFPKIIEFRTQLHIIVNFIEYEILKSIFDKGTFDKIMERELSLKGLKSSWDVVLANEEKLRGIIRPVS